MNTEVVFIIIVVFLVADFIVERILEWVNMRAMAPVLPENLKGIYDEKEYARFQNYKRETNRFDLISSTFSFIVMMVFLCTDEFVKWPWVFHHYRQGKWAQNITRENLFEQTAS